MQFRANRATSEEPEGARAEGAEELAGATSGVLTFGAFELDLDEQVLRRSGARVRLQAQPLKVLAMLATQAGSLVTRDAIQRCLWEPDTHVDYDQGINACIKAVRAALGDRAAAPRFVETVPRRGYRFVAPVERRPVSPAAVPNDQRGSDHAPAAAPDDQRGCDHAPAATPNDQRGSDRMHDRSIEFDLTPAHPLAPVQASPTPGRRGDSPALASDGSVFTPDRRRLTPAAPASRAEPATPDSGPVTESRPRGRAHTVWGPLARGLVLAGVLALALAGSIALLSRTTAPAETSAAVTAAPAPTEAVPSTSAAPAAPARPSLAVMPFEPLSPDPDHAYVGDAMTAELISQLSRRYGRGLGVIAFTSTKRYKDSDRPVAEIAAELEADYLLEGSVRREGSQLRVTAQLVRPDDAQPIWAGSYDRDVADLLAVQAELGETIAHALALELSPAPARPRPLPAAYDAYLEGRWHLDRGGRDAAARSAAHFGEAIALDPDFAAAHAGLARARLNAPRPPDERYPPARVAARAALVHDPTSAEAHMVLAQVSFYYDWDLEAARRSFERAIELDPGFADAHHAFAAYYSVTGRHDRAKASVERARSLDPLSPFVNSDLGWYDYFARRYDRAVAHCQRTLAMEPGFYWAHQCLILSHLAAGDRAAAVRAARAEMRDAGAPAERVAQVSEHDPERGLRAYWRWDIERKRAPTEAGIVAPIETAVAYLALGQRDDALTAIEASVSARSGWRVPFLRVDPLFDPLRDEPRFRAALARIEAGTP
ncbi:winged helix-turn-helix domain-containing protein [Haliangium sp.]|uniref:winged helix-turn-helix domain-containing tetratricopeptide repeat protein n=1 Tax=Haliangium sp. TaxID=2663208 RepID=UPI003D12D4E3